MKLRIKTTYFFWLIALSACENKLSKQPSKITHAPLLNTALDTISLKDNSPRYNNSSFDNPQKQYQQTKSYSLQEIWDEGDDIRNEAENILNQAESIGCEDAIWAAQNAIFNSDDCTNTNNYYDAENYLDDAQSELSNAQNYLEDCQNRQEENETDEEKEDE